MNDPLDTILTELAYPAWKDKISAIVDTNRKGKTKMNQFFNPDECPFEVIGFTEELVECKTNRLLGSRKITEPTRPLGSKGMIEFDLTEPTVLNKGHKEVTVKASPKKPVRVFGMIQIVCGRVKKKSA